MGGGGSSEVKETSAEKAQASVAADQWSYYQSNLKQYEDLFMDNMFKVNSVLEYGELKEFIFEQDVKKDADNLVKCLRIVLHDLRIERERKNREIQIRETNLRKFHAYRMFCDF